MKEKNKKLRPEIIFIVLLLAINFVAHFIPFERASLAPDDYSLLNWIETSGQLDVLSYLLRYPDRPLNYLLLDIQYKLIADNAFKGLFFIVLISIFVLLVTFFLLREIFDDVYLAFLCSVFYCLLPNKLEVYHTPIYANLHLIIGIYILSLLFYSYYIKTHKITYLILSLFTYIIGIFSYEVGYFMPFLMFIYGKLKGHKKTGSSILYFVFPMGFYLLYRLTGAFGLFDTSIMSRRIGFQIFSLFELFHQFFGRSMIRNLYYGVYKFLSIEPAWLLVIIVFNLALLFVLNYLLRRVVLAKISLPIILFATIIFITFTTPIMMYSSGGISGRHVVLPSIGFVIFLLWLFEKFGEKWRFIFLIFVIIALVVSEGNAWTQVVACRINGAIYETLKEKKGKICCQNNLIINAASFADNIPFTHLKRNFNILNTYYGAQALEDWGLESMVKLVCGDKNNHVFIAKKSPLFTKNGLVEFQVSTVVKYRTVSYKSISIPLEDTEIIGFNEVFGQDFNNGLRRK